jgi:hypothetical protein
MRCAYHPDVETNLRCGKCDKPICPRCMVPTPVGARCRDCAGLDKLPTFRVSTRYYLIAAGTALGMAIAGGAAWGLIEWAIGRIGLIFSLSLLLAPAAGYAIGEVTSLAVNRKRGTGLAVVSGIAAALSYGVVLFSPGGLPIGIFSIVYHIIAVALGIFVAVSRLR